MVAVNVSNTYHDAYAIFANSSCSGSVQYMVSNIHIATCEPYGMHTVDAVYGQKMQ